jgi:hypothetical protein
MAMPTAVSLVDENGDLVNPSTLTALIADRELKKIQDQILFTT